jgi:hypothetical protein
MLKAIDKEMAAIWNYAPGMSPRDVLLLCKIEDMLDELHERVPLTD